MSLLEIKNCTIRYQNGTPAVSNVSFNVEKGQIVSLVGESGSGKTTLIRAILGILPSGGRVTEGQIILDGTDLLTLSERQLESVRGNNISMIFQDVGASMDPVKLVRSQYAESILVHERLPKETCIERALSMLKKMHLTEPKRVMASYPFELSGGMKQRVGIAMGMTAQPKLLLADEPTSALDVTIQAQVVREIKELRDKYGATIILVTHNMGVASYLSDMIGVMQKSRMVEFGTRDEIILHPREQYTKDLMDAVPKIGGKRFAR